MFNGGTVDLDFYLINHFETLYPYPNPQRTTKYQLIKAASCNA